MTGKETRRAIKHLLHQMSHGHRVEQHFDDETGVLRFFLVSPRRGGFGQFGHYRSEAVPVEVICAARERGDFKLWRGTGRHTGLRQTRKLTRREQRRLQQATARRALEREQHRRERRENPRFVDLYYREGAAHRWKPYFAEPLPSCRAGEAWSMKNKLRRAKRTRHLQTVVVSGGRDIRDPAAVTRKLAEAAERYERNGIL
jgi:hypothetical protein